MKKFKPPEKLSRSLSGSLKILSPGFSLSWNILKRSNWIRRPRSMLSLRCFSLPSIRCRKSTPNRLKKSSPLVTGYKKLSLPHSKTPSMGSKTPPKSSANKSKPSSTTPTPHDSTKPNLMTRCNKAMTCSKIRSTLSKNCKELTLTTLNGVKNCLRTGNNYSSNNQTSGNSFAVTCSSITGGTARSSTQRIPTRTWTISGANCKNNHK